VEWGLGKSMLWWTFLDVPMVVFLSELNIVALYANLFEKLGKSKMKNWNLHSNLSNPKEKITKMINIQSKVDFIKDGISNVPSPNYSKKSYHYGFFSSREVKN